MNLEPGQLYWDEGGRNFLLLIERTPCDDLYWCFVVFYPYESKFVHIRDADPRESIILHCKRVY